MKVTTKAVFDMKTGRLLHWEGYEYDGPVAMCGGGPSSEQKAAAAAQANLASSQAATGKEMLGFFKDQYGKINNYATDRLNNGLPFLPALTDFNKGVSARNAVGARASMLRSLGPVDKTAPSGFKAQLLSDMENARRRDFDSTMASSLFANEQAKQNAAATLTGQQTAANPLGWSGQASQTNNSIMNAPLQSPGWGGVLGGAITGLGSAAITKF